MEAAYLLGVEVWGIVLVLAFPFALEAEGKRERERTVQDQCRSDTG